MGIIILKIGLFFIAYLIGSIPNGLWIGKVFLNIKLNEHGSKNVGASNAIRVMGLKLGLLTLFFDVFKTSIIIIFTTYLLPLWLNDFQTTFQLFGKVMNYSILYGFAGIIGHTFSPFLKFKGGKAVAASLGVIITLTPIPGLICIVVYFTTVILTKYASVGSTLAAISVGISTYIQFLLTKRLELEIFTFSVYILIILFIFYKHIPNYIRLFKGEENKMYLIKKKEQ